jgi:hypothetical protein
MKTSKIKTEFIDLNMWQSNVFDPSFVVEIQNDIIKQYIKNNNEIYPLVITPEMEMIPFEVRSSEPVESINLTVCIIDEKINTVKYDAEINWFDILFENNKTYIHRSCLNPSTLAGELQISPLYVSEIRFKSGRILKKDSNTEFILLLNKSN